MTVEVVPGLTAALCGGAVLGAPLAHDFCVISLSDQLTRGRSSKSGWPQRPWAISAWRCITLLPRGAGDLRAGLRILPENGKAPDTVCGLVRNIGREGQAITC